MRHDDLRDIPRTILQPELLEEATIPPWNQPFEETDPKRGSEGATSQKIMPPKVRASVALDTRECSCLTLFARVLIWATRNSGAE